MDNCFTMAIDTNLAHITCAKCHITDDYGVSNYDSSMDVIMHEVVGYARRDGWRVIEGNHSVYAICKHCYENPSGLFESAENPMPIKRGGFRMNEIERKFAEALCRECGVDSLEDMPDEEEHCLSLCEPQKPIGIYIVDFYMEDCSNNKYAVEIDGHESHKTKIQRYEDYVRERFLQKQLITVIRFTGSEVFVDAGKCVKDCLEIIDAYAENTSGIEIHAFEAGRKCTDKSA